MILFLLSAVTRDLLIAKTDYIYKLFIRTRGNIVSIINYITEDETNNEILIDKDEGGTIETTNLQEAEEITNGIISYPTYLPEGYTLKKITVQKTKQSTSSILLEYQNKEENRSLRIRELILYDNSSISINFKKDSMKMEKFNKDGVEYILLIPQKGFYSRLIWNYYGKNYTLTADLGKEELLKIAESMKW